MTFVIAAPSSGSGKTSLSLLLASWAKSKSKTIQCFKVGPDYLDSNLLTAVSERNCRNLDLPICGSDWIKDSFHGFSGSADFVLIEGVMGLFDGVGNTREGSTAEVAKCLGLPIVLVVDARGQSSSLAALVEGFKNHDPEIELAGVVLNHVSSSRHKALLADVLFDIGVKVLGCLPHDSSLALPSKHLGLSPSHEIQNLKKRIEKWASISEKSLDIKSFIKLLNPPNISCNPIDKLYARERSLRKGDVYPIAIASDEAFHFHYKETEECLEASGMHLIPWRLTEDNPIPKEAKGVIIPGGFPEQYAEQISSCNQSIKSLKEIFLEKPIYAECGGMLLLGKSLKDVKDKEYQMAGLLPFKAARGSLKVGYRTLISLENSLILEKGDKLTGHEFHQWEIIDEGFNSKDQEFLQRYRQKRKLFPIWSMKGWGTPHVKEGWANQMLHASWVHLHWPSSPKIISLWKDIIMRADD